MGFHAEGYAAFFIPSTHDPQLSSIPLGFDGLAAATQKGLLGMYGLGVLYCRREWIPRMRPPFLARSGVDDGTLHESSATDLACYRFHGDARRFEVGNHNFAGLSRWTPHYRCLLTPACHGSSGMSSHGASR